MRTLIIPLTTLTTATTLLAQQPTPSPGVRYDRLLIRNALVIDGAGNPTRGPFDIVVEGSTIASIRPHRADANIRADRVIDATGMHVMPGIIDLHGHIMFSRNREPLPKDYVYKLWLGHGITTIREPGSGEGIDTVVHHARLSAENRIAAPTIIPYAVPGGTTPEQGRASVRRLKERGAMGLKVFVLRPDVWEAVMDEAHKLEFPVATDMKIQEYDALDAARLGVRTIEHWYGIPDAAIPGPQDFPEAYNYDNELDRFRWAGDLWRQADPDRLSSVLDTMLAHNVSWDPTLAVYEVNRDLVRAQNLPWFDAYAMPNLLAFFEPDPSRHGSYHFEWTTNDEVMWRENYQIWMKWVREYAARGGNVTVGSDAGFMYHLYGFGTIRELEFHREAGFHPIEVIQHATWNGAKALGLATTGVVRPGFEADLLVVDGNPLHNLKVLYGTGVTVEENGRMVRRGGVRFTIKDGIVFDAPALLEEVKQMVRQAKQRTAAP
ncbi:MAG: amidohydrolase family protein [Gemmatimonadales bacterium]|nr:amidohydrolase family protein [Gemmatimonadales bacterium]NIN11784.1 amidohydrolase family protein [Gemmatimonadales bacterium]NIN50340.1 amidohydrolase family protein [Gemmatimonadales bacterium]NIP07804.1 amidohydrolase family protein [Gemmatimonadales bacterium]NIQ99236.1 amidohydrolase family protein [Gemmatimonadales bacterium]